MVGLLEFRQKLKAFYGNYSIYIIPCIKFLTVFLTLITINSNIGYMGRLNSMTIVLLLSLSYIPPRRILYSLLTVVLSGQIIGLVSRAPARREEKDRS